LAQATTSLTRHTFGCLAMALVLALLAAALVGGVSASSASSFASQAARYGCLEGHEHYLFCNTQLPLEQRVDDLISRLTLDEKPTLLEARYSPLGNISRLGVPQYDWGGNCIHGVQSRCGTGSQNDTRCPTSFPNPNHLGASFNYTSWQTMGRVIGVEMRSLWRQGVGENHGSNLPPFGLDCWSPNINVVRDPRWGRNMETASEDPYLLSWFGIGVTEGLQKGDDRRYLQGVVTLKHFVANSLEGTWSGPGGPAKYPGTGLCPGGKCTRHTIDPNISAYDLASTYLKAFKASVVQGGALGVMCSYNSVNGVPSCANQWLLGQKLRKEWGFKGYVTGDSGAVADIYNQHFYAPTMEDAVVDAVNAGTDVQSGGWPKDHPWSVRGQYIDMIPKAVRAGKLSEQAVDEALRHTLMLRFRLGLFDPPDNQPYEHVSPDAVRSPEHIAAAVDATEQGLVLLKNEQIGKGTRALPIRSGRIAAIGPHVTSRGALLGNYIGQICPGNQGFDCVENFLEALSALKAEVTYAPGLSGLTSTDTSLFPHAVEVAKTADSVVLFLGLDSSEIEKEGQDRKDISLPSGQLALFDAVIEAGKPVTVVLLNGGIVAAGKVKDHASAIVEAWYPGFFGARAVARSLLGLTNRWGKLPVTIYGEKYIEQVDMLDFDMAKAPGRTYKYFTDEPLWPFGFGLSYTDFKLQVLSGPVAQVPQQGGGAGKDYAVLKLQVENVGKMAGDEVVLAFFRPLPGTLPSTSRAAKIRKQLFDFRRVGLQAGEKSDTLYFFVRASTFAVHADNGDEVSYAGSYEVQLTNGLQVETVRVDVVAAAALQPVVLDAWTPTESNDDPMLVI